MVGRNKLTGLLLITFFILSVVPLVLSEVGTSPYLEVNQPVYPRAAKCVEEVGITLPVEGQVNSQGVLFPADVMLLIDRSWSMHNGQNFNDAKIANKNFTDELDNTSDKVGLVSFNQLASLNQQLTYDQSSVKGQIDALSATGSTNTRAAIDKANSHLISNGRGNVQWVMVLVTDGEAPGSSDALPKAQAAANNSIVIYTIGLGNDINETLLREIANVTGGKYYFALDPNRDNLSDIYLEIADELATGNSCVTDNDCDNNLYCDGPELCVNNVCQAGVPINCDDSVVCTDDSCDENVDSCVNNPIDANCDDGVYCNGVEYCDPVLGCQTTPVQVECQQDADCGCLSDRCIDADFDGDADDYADYPDNGLCVDCNCSNGTGVGEPCAPGITFNDAVHCSVCVTDGDCDNGVFCDGPELCVGGYCQVAVPLTCDDSVVCTDDSCDEINDQCVNTANDGLCDNGLFCDGVEVCDPLADCQPGNVVDCSGNDILVAECFYVPDGDNSTWDSYSFTSLCDEGNDVCTAAPVGWENQITHTQSIQCGGECQEDSDCGITECDYLDGCYEGFFRDYHDVSMVCVNSQCLDGSCDDYNLVVTDNDGDGYNTECTGECDDGNYWIHPGAVEICNGEDDDCDGWIDEDIIQVCGEGVCAGTQSCYNHLWSECSTSGKDPGTCAICDAEGNLLYDDTQDADCSTITCPEDGCGVGNCGLHIWGDYPELASQCVGLYVCSQESCEDYLVCEEDLDGDGYSVSCGDLDDDNADVYPGVEEACNGLDDDGDGVVDENTTQSRECSSDVGICVSGYEFNYCVDGVYTGWDDCTGVLPTEEICNGLDDDCDGVTDDNLTLSRECGETDVGICDFGEEFRYCIAGEYSDWDDCNAVLPKDGEICGNDEDDDCDGKVDEGCSSGGGSSGIGSKYKNKGKVISVATTTTLPEEETTTIPVTTTLPEEETTTTVTTTTLPPTTTLPLATTTTTLLESEVVGAAVTFPGGSMSAFFVFLLLFVALPVVFLFWWKSRRYVATPGFLTALDYQQLKSLVEGGKQLYVTEGMLKKDNRLQTFVDEEKIKVIQLEKDRKVNSKIKNIKLGELIEKLKLTMDEETVEAIALALQMRARLFAKSKKEVNLALSHGLNVLLKL